MDPEISLYDDRLADFCLDCLKLKAGNRILDAGCGAGDVAFRLASRFMKVTGIDISSELINHCKEVSKRHLDGSENVRFLVEDMRKPMDLDPFSGIICLGVTFGYFEESVNEACFKNLAKLLKKGGRLIIESDDPYSLEEGWVYEEFKMDLPLPSVSTQAMLKLKRRFVKRTSSYEGFFHLQFEDGRKLVLSEALTDACDEHIRIYSMEELSEIALKSGLVLETVYGDSLLPAKNYVPGSSRRLVTQFIRP
jgi:SAM-dependent methyltransferase